MVVMLTVAMVTVDMVIAAMVMVAMVMTTMVTVSMVMVVMVMVAVDTCVLSYSASACLLSLTNSLNSATVRCDLKFCSLNNCTC